MVYGKHMRDHNPLSPWNPKVPAEITPTEFEKIVLAWLRKCGLSDNQEIEVRHLGTIEGVEGNTRSIFLSSSASSVARRLLF